MNDSTKTLNVYRYIGAELEKIAEIKIAEIKNVLELLNAHKISINQSCGGYATCTTCRVIVKSGIENLEPRNELEHERALERNYAPNERLACQSEIRTDKNAVIDLIVINFKD